MFSFCFGFFSAQHQLNMQNSLLHAAAEIVCKRNHLNAPRRALQLRTRLLDLYSQQHRMFLLLIDGHWEGSQGPAHCASILVPFTLSLRICGWLLSEMGHWANKVSKCKNIMLR